MEEILRRATQDTTIAKRQRDETEERASQANEYVAMANGNIVFTNKQAALVMKNLLVQGPSSLVA
ncbi:hypothetical protein AGMMS49936_10710 [Endomicrobiia bacterium]|nr:hypothetical protein AGMMS49936_10710 [Endomicrobiia bacterium]